MTIALPTTGLETARYSRAARGVFAAVFFATIWMGAFPPAFDLHGFGSTAWADDGDNGDDGDDGDDGDGGSAGVGSGGGSSAGDRDRNRGGLGNHGGSRTRPSVNRTATLPARADREIVALGLDDDDIAELSAQGFAVLDDQTLQIVGARLFLLSTPQGLSLEQARAIVTDLNPEALVDFNHFYRAGGDTAVECSGPHCRAASAISWPVGSDALSGCPIEARIGLIDTGINADHATFRNRQLEVIDMLPGGKAKSGRKHGTAVAAILLGSAESRSPGLLPDSTVIAVDAFHRGGSRDERSDVHTLVRAMDRLAERDVTVINLSLSGPPNLLLEAMTGHLNDASIVLVAAAGNAGPRAKPAYPAAYPRVIAVTAVDGNGNVYRRAGRGAHIDLAAPGVDVWTAASIRGARTKTGTSFATPFVTAAVALAQVRLGLQGHEQLVDALAANALDLGAPGRDDIFGYGLVQAVGTCAPHAAHSTD